jgi:hypothetical protein
MRYLLTLAVLAVLAVGARGQLILTSALALETPSGLEVRAAVSYWSPPYDDIVGEWFAFLAPGLSPSSPTHPPYAEPWGGSPPPLGLGIEWLGTVLPAPSGPIFSAIPQVQTGEAIPIEGEFGGCAFGYAAMGSSLSGLMDVAVWAIPVSVSVMEVWVYFAGRTISEQFGPRYWGAWGRIR